MSTVRLPGKNTEWVVVSSRDLPSPGIRLQVCRIAGEFFFSLSYREIAELTVNCGLIIILAAPEVILPVLKKH